MSSRAEFLEMLKAKFMAEAMVLRQHLERNGYNLEENRDVFDASYNAWVSQKLRFIQEMVSAGLF